MGWIGGELVKEMIKELMAIYETSRLNDGAPECIFAETLIFNEGWLLRGTLNEWRRCRQSNLKFPFLPFPKGATVYSEAQLFTPFKKRVNIDTAGETNTHVDGVVGSFSFPETKSGLVLDKDATYLAVFEAKVYSGLSRGIKNSGNYSQVSRTIACIINSVIKTGISKDDNPIYYIVIYPNDNYKIDPAIYTKEFIETQIEERISGYKQGGAIKNEFNDFEMQWLDVLKRVTIQFVTWEAVLDEIDDNDINKFFELCKRFNRK